MNVYSFDVEVSNHDALQQGILAVRLFGCVETFHRIIIAADTFEEAELAAQQMAAGTTGMMPTATYPRI